MIHKGFRSQCRVALVGRIDQPKKPAPAPLDAQWHLHGRGIIRYFQGCGGLNVRGRHVKDTAKCIHQTKRLKGDGSPEQGQRIGNNLWPVIGARRGEESAQIVQAQELFPDPIQRGRRQILGFDEIRQGIQCVFLGCRQRIACGLPLLLRRNPAADTCLKSRPQAPMQRATANNLNHLDIIGVGFSNHVQFIELPISQRSRALQFNPPFQPKRHPGLSPGGNPQWARAQPLKVRGNSQLSRDLLFQGRLPERELLPGFLSRRLRIRKAARQGVRPAAVVATICGVEPEHLSFNAALILRANLVLVGGSVGQPAAAVGIQNQSFTYDGQHFGRDCARSQRGHQVFRLDHAFDAFHRLIGVTAP